MSEHYCPPHPVIVDPQDNARVFGYVETDSGRKYVGHHRWHKSRTSDILYHTQILGARTETKQQFILNQILSDIKTTSTENNERTSTVVFTRNRQLLDDIIANIPRNRESDVCIIDDMSRDLIPTSFANKDINFPFCFSENMDVQSFFSRIFIHINTDIESRNLLRTIFMFLSDIYKDININELMKIFLLFLEEESFRSTSMERMSKSNEYVNKSYMWIVRHLKGKDLQSLADSARSYIYTNLYLKAFFTDSKKTSILELINNKSIILICSDDDAYNLSMFVNLLWSVNTYCLLPFNKRPTTFCYLDNINFENMFVSDGELKSILAETRIMRLALTFINDSISILKDEMRDALLNCGNRLMLKPSKVDEANKNVLDTFNGKVTVEDLQIMNDNNIYIRMMVCGDNYFVKKITADVNILPDTTDILSTSQTFVAEEYQPNLNNETLEHLYSNTDDINRLNLNVLDENSTPKDVAAYCFLQMSDSGTHFSYKKVVDILKKYSKSEYNEYLKFRKGLYQRAKDLLEMCPESYLPNKIERIKTLSRLKHSIPLHEIEIAKLLW